HHYGMCQSLYLFAHESTPPRLHADHRRNARPIQVGVNDPYFTSGEGKNRGDIDQQRTLPNPSAGAAKGNDRADSNQIAAYAILLLKNRRFGSLGKIKFSENSHWLTAAQSSPKRRLLESFKTSFVECLLGNCS